MNGDDELWFGYATVAGSYGTVTMNELVRDTWRMTVERRPLLLSQAERLSESVVFILESTVSRVSNSE